MRILILFQGIFGGSDLLFARFSAWCRRKNMVVTESYPGNDHVYDRTGYDLVLLTSSQLGELFAAKKNGAVFSHILVWILGMGMLQESYFNPARSKGLEFFIKKYLLKRGNSMVRILNACGALCYTDIMGQSRTLKEAGIEPDEYSEKKRIPIAISIPELKSVKKQDDYVTDRIRFGWVGRIANDFKVIPILDLMDQLEKISKDRKISLTIVGTGDGYGRIEAKMREMNYEIHAVENVAYDLLGEYIKEHFDILAAMGTSALDGGKVGVPTMILSPVRENDPHIVSYRWIHESLGFSLGEYPGDQTGVKQVKKKFSEMIREYMSHKKELSQLSYEYTLHFDENKVFEKLLSLTPEQLNEAAWKEIRFMYRLNRAKDMVKKLAGRIFGKSGGET